MKKNRGMSIVMLLGVMVFIVSLPLMLPYCINNTNIQFYLERITVANIGDGFLLIPGMLYRMQISVEVSYRIYLFFINCVSVLVAYWSFYKIFNIPEIALIGTMLYNFAPYRINAMYIKGDIGEVAALSFIPLVFLGLFLIVSLDCKSNNYKRLSLLLIVAYSAVLQADLLTFLILLGVTILLILILWKSFFRKDVLLIVGQSILGIGILNFFFFASLIKFLIQKETVSTYFNATFIQEKGVYLLHYIIPYFKNGNSIVSSEFGFGNTQPLGMGFALTLCMFVYLWICFSKDRKKPSTLFAKWGDALAIVGVSMLIISTNSFPWDFLQKECKIFAYVVNVIYTPSRFIPIVIACFSIVSCVTIYQIKDRNKEIYKYFILVIFTTGFIMTVYLLGDIIATGEIYNINNFENYGEYNNLDLSPLDYLKYIN